MGPRGPIFVESWVGTPMVDMHNLIDLQITIFCLMLAGYIMTRLGVLPPSSRKPLTDLVIDFILPCNIIVSFLIPFNAQILKACLAVLCVSVGIQLFCSVAGRLFYPGASPQRLACLRYATVVSNAGFLGNPIVQGLYGTQGLVYASIYLIPQRIVMWSAGVAYFTDAKGKGVFKKVATHPCILAATAGLVLMIFQIPLPSGITKTLTYGSNCATALSVIVIGNILAEVDPREVVSRQALWFCAVRLLIVPLLVLLACRLVGLEPLVGAVSTVLAGMPAGATTAVLAAKYGCDEHFGVALVFLSTILSLATIPLLCVLMSFV